LRELASSQTCFGPLVCATIEGRTFGPVLTQPISMKGKPVSECLFLW